MMKSENWVSLVLLTGFWTSSPCHSFPTCTPSKFRERERETDHPGIGDGAEIRVDDLADIPCKGLACLS